MGGNDEALSPMRTRMYSYEYYMYLNAASPYSAMRSRAEFLFIENTQNVVHEAEAEAQESRQKERRGEERGHQYREIWLAYGSRGKSPGAKINSER